jgi:hypothetical protein
MAGCVAVELALVMSGLDRTPLTAGLVVLSGAAVVIALGESLGLRREPWGVRAIIGVPLTLLVVTTVVLVLEAGYRRGLVLP